MSRVCAQNVSTISALRCASDHEPLISGDSPRLVRDRAETLAQACSADPQAVWEWGYIERVSTGLANVRNFDNDDGAMFLEVALRCL